MFVVKIDNIDGSKIYINYAPIRSKNSCKYSFICGRHSPHIFTGNDINVLIREAEGLPQRTWEFDPHKCSHTIL